MTFEFNTSWPRMWISTSWSTRNMLHMRTSPARSPRAAQCHAGEKGACSLPLGRDPSAPQEHVLKVERKVSMWLIVSCHGQDPHESWASRSQENHSQSWKKKYRWLNRPLRSVSSPARGKNSDPHQTQLGLLWEWQQRRWWPNGKWHHHTRGEI